MKFNSNDVILKIYIFFCFVPTKSYKEPCHFIQYPHLLFNSLDLLVFVVFILQSLISIRW